MSLAEEWYNAGKDFEVLDKQKYLGAERPFDGYITYYYGFQDGSLGIVCISTFDEYCSATTSNTDRLIKGVKLDKDTPSFVS